MSRELEAVSNELASLQVESERLHQRYIRKETREATALLMMTIAMGQAAYLIHKKLIENLPFTNLSKQYNQRAKRSLEQAIKSMKVAKGCFADFDSMQEEFTSSKAIDTEGQAIVMNDTLANYHEIAELCALYMNAYSANHNIMQLLRPILIGQSKHDTNGIRPETINKYKQL